MHTIKSRLYCIATWDNKSAALKLIHMQIRNSIHLANIKGKKIHV